MHAKLIAAAALGLLSASPANASYAAGGYVTGFTTVQDGHVMFVYTDGIRGGGTPACSDPNFPKRWAFDPTTVMGQAVASVLLTARGLHDPVTLYGDGACNFASNSETLVLVITNNAQ